jgi:hypothetical protein
MTRRQITVWVAGALLLVCAGALVGTTVTRALDVPPSNGQSLAAIVQSVEQNGLGVIQSIEYEREWWQLSGSWEIKTCKERCLRLRIDPKSGKEVHRKSYDLEQELPPVNTQGPSVIATSFERGKLGVITEIEFEDGVWQVEFRENGGLWGAWEATKRRVFQPAPNPVSKGRGSDAPPPAHAVPGERLRPSRGTTLIYI